MITGQEWLNQNAGRAYPIQEDMGRHPTVRGVKMHELQLPNSLLLDLYIAVAGAEDLRVWVSKVVLADAFVGLTFSDITTGTVIGTVSTTATGPRTNAVIVPAAGVNCTGSVVIGDPADVRVQLPDGVYDFDVDETELETCVVRSFPAALDSLQIQDGDNLSTALTGAVKLVAGENVTLTYDSARNAVIINAVPDAGYFADCGPCPVEDNVVRTINGIPLQDVQLVSGNDCVRIDVSGNKITITDTCSTPCCGCAELAAATSKLMEFEKPVTDVALYRQRLEAAILLLEQALAQTPKAG